MPKPVEKPKSPKDYASTDELYFTGQRIEQLYSPSFEAQSYYEEIVRRDPGDYRANTALGILLCKQWRWDEAAKHLSNAVARAAANYIRPKDGEAFYYLGVAQRAQDNPALQFACGQAQRLGVPVVVVFTLLRRYPEATLRHFRFMLEGLAETGQALSARGIPLVVRWGEPVPVVLGLAQLLFALGVLAAGAFWLHLAPEALMTLAFLTLVCAGQATIYAIRVRGWLWETPPGRWLVAASVADLLIGAGVALGGAITAPLPGAVVLGVLAASALLAPALNGLRRLASARLGL